LGPRPGLKEVNLVCWALFVAFLIVPMCVVQWVHVKHGQGSIRLLHSDFVYFYGIGEIAREFPASSIYDYKLQQQVFTSICPPRDGVYGPSPYPPFVALFFLPFAHLTFESAYLVWAGISFVLYLTGIWAVARRALAGERLKISLILCFALECFPFLLATLINGQLAAVAVCAVGLAVYQEENEAPFRSGLALALLAYKPTLLLLLFPMLLLTRRFRTLLGFATGVGVLAIAATAIGGPKIWPAYAHMLRYFGSVSGIRGASRLQLWKYLDLSSFFTMFPGVGSGIRTAVLSFIATVSAVGLSVLLWKSVVRGRPAQRLAWAATLTWTLLLNVYAPIYDSVLVVIAIILMLGALRDLRWGTAAEWTTFVSVITFAVSWVTEPVAKAHGIQLLTVALFILGTMQLLFLYRAEYRRPASQSADRALL
jgi:hypothetical protein